MLCHFFPYILMNLCWIDGKIIVQVIGFFIEFEGVYLNNLLGWWHFSFLQGGLGFVVLEVLNMSYRC